MVKVVLDLPGVNTVRAKLAGGRYKTYYYRRSDGKRLPDDPASPEFAQALKETAPAEEEKGNHKPGSVAALIAAYRKAPDFTSKSEKTRKDYGVYLEILLELWGDLPVTGIRRGAVLELRDEFADTPRKANYLLSVLRLVLNFAVDREWRNDNPALNPRLLQTGEGHKAWPEELIAQFRAAAPPHVRDAFELAFYTGQRKGDVLTMTERDRGRDGIAVKQEKTDKRVWVPEHQELTAYLDGRPADRRHFLLCTTVTGRQYTKNNFDHDFRETVLAIKADGYTFHGLRHTAGANLAEAGCSEAEIIAILGCTPEMARHYVRQAQQKLLARSAIRKLERKGKADQDADN